MHPSSLIDCAAVPAACPPDAGGGEDLFEAAVLFTDMRGSSDLVTRTTPREYFRLLNTSLSAQAECVRGFEGDVIKYTGDGLMAVFRGMGRSSLALRCALALARTCEREPGLPFGIGVADGPVLAGFVGPETPGERHYDVVGATVHLAARLCAMAGAGEVMTTTSTHDTAQLPAAALRPMGPVAVPGFPEAIECVAFERGAATASL
ncbi:adenylate/guanylate cyclase domain-containing protein [Ramlibacter sp. MMS24-I3-19]|uniref:adenylate/guanylate cyclase domain-containing protein n=1 Tax=Ramlibacter sp. MMS24-I3-19 TaxID=3416606 RepID=UPI003D07C530